MIISRAAPDRVSNRLFAAFAPRALPIASTCGFATRTAGSHRSPNRSETSHSASTYHYIQFFSFYSKTFFIMPAAPKQRKIAIVGSRSVGMSLDQHRYSRETCLVY
jgi:hypothetical protein